jgi:hypothetical protein
MGDAVSGAAKPSELLLHLAAVTAPVWIDVFRKLAQSYKPEKTLTDGGEGPAMPAGVSNHVWKIEETVALLG